MLEHAKLWLRLIAVSWLVFGTSMPAAAQVVPSDCSTTAGLTHRMAVCLRTTVDNGAQQYFTEVTSFLQQAITAAITLAIVLYGVLLSFGMVEKVGRDTFVLLFKLTVVTFLVANSALIFTTMTGIMDGASTAVTRFVPASGRVDNTNQSDFASVYCLQNIATQRDAGGNPMPAASPWLGVDCMLDTIVGIRIPSTNNPNFNAVFYNPNFDAGAPQNTGLARGLMNFFFSSAHSSVIGLVLAIVGGLFIWGTLMLVVRAFFTYIFAYIGLALLAIVSPLFVPMLLFRETKQYFDKWVKMLISFTLQPVLMLVFIIFTVTAVDLVVFSGNYSIMYRIAGDASREQGFNLNSYLTAPRNSGGDAVLCTRNNCSSDAIISPRLEPFLLIKGDNPEPAGTTGSTGPAGTTSEIFNSDTGGVAHGIKYSQCTEENIARDSTGMLRRFCGYVYPVSNWLQEIRWDRLAAARIINGTQGAVVPPNYPEVLVNGVNDPRLQAGQFVLREVLAASFLALMVVFIMRGLVAIVPGIVGDLLGDALQGPNLAKEGMNSFSGQVSSATSQLANNISSMVTTRK